MKKILLGIIGLASCFGAAAENFKIITYNTLYGFNHGKSNKIGYQWIKEQAPDVIALQEMKKFSQEKLAKAAKTWGHDYVHYYQRKPGQPLAVTSKYPITEIKPLTAKGIKRASLLFKVENIYFINLHLTSQTVADRAKESKQLSGVIKNLIADGKQLVVLGDFNALSPLDKPYLDTMSTMLKVYQDHPKKIKNLTNNQFDYTVIQRFLDTGLVDSCYQKLKGSPVLNGSFPTTVLEKIATEQDHKDALHRLDYVLMTPELAAKVTSANIPREGVVNKISDHYPVIVELDK